MSKQSRAAKAIKFGAARGYTPEQIATLLNELNLLAEDLPEPSFVMDEDGEKRICWNTPDCDIELEPGEMIITREAQAGHTIEDARQTGLALLAAANYQEGSNA